MDNGIWINVHAKSIKHGLKILWVLVSGEKVNRMGLGMDENRGFLYFT